MLMNMKSNSKVGKAATETASIAYTGELLPTGTASYAGISLDATKRYLKNSGKDKTPALVESGQGKFFNGTNQYINTGIIPNQAQGTLITRFTYVTGQVSRCIIGNTEISIWVNASGNIEGLFGNAVITSTDVLVNGRSYHVELPYLGLNASIKVDNVVKASGTATAFNPTLPMAIGARLTAITPTLDRYFNNVIDETYYYDVALTDSQTQSLYLYPEKVKSYNGAIVPDIGSEANCKLFLPLCENSGSNVVNVAVATSITEICGDSQMDGNGWWTLSGSGISFSGGVLTFNATSDYSGVNRYNDSNLSINKIFYCEIDIVSITSNIECGIRDGSLFVPFVSLGIKNIVGKQQFIFKSGGLDFRLYGKIGNPWSCTSLTIKEITNKCYPLASYTTAMHTSAAKLSYGAQCTAWNRDSLGVLLGMSGSMSYDANVSVKPVFTSWVPKYDEDWCCEVIQYNDGVGIELNGVNATTRFSIGMNGIYAYIYATGVFKSVVVDTGWHHLFARYTASTKTFVLTLNGVAQAPIVSSSFTSDPLYSFCIGAERNGVSTSSFYLGNRVILKQYNAIQSAKITEAKSWANAQKIIAKLGA